MRSSMVAILFSLRVLTAFGESESSIDLLEYVDRFLANSIELEETTQAALEAREAFDDAKVGLQSTYVLGLLESELIYREALLLAAESANVRLAFQTVFASMAATESLRFASIAEEIATAVYTRSEELSSKEYVSVRDALVANMAYMQAGANTHAAADAKRAAQNALIRSIVGEMACLEVEVFDLAIQMPEIPEARLWIEHDHEVVKLRTNLRLHGGRRDFMFESNLFSPAEIGAIEQKMVDVERALQQRVWFLDDHLEQRHSQIAGNTEAKTIAEINSRVKSIELEQARYEYERGDIYASDLTAAELALEVAEEEIASLKRGHLLLVLDALSIANVRTSQWVNERWGGGSAAPRGPHSQPGRATSAMSS